MVSPACAVTGPEGGATASRFDFFARRRAPRARIACSVRLRCDGAELTGTTTDVSMVGLFVATRQFLGDGTRVQVSFAVGRGARAEPVEAEGWVVRRVTTGQAAERGGVAGMGIQLERFRSGREALRQAIDELLGNVAGDGEAAPGADSRRARPAPDPDAIDELALAALAALQAAETGALRPELGDGPEWCASQLAAGDLDATLPLLRLASMRESRGQLRWLSVAATGLKVAALAVALLMTGFGVLLISRV
jgi:hypothetical protein